MPKWLLWALLVWSVAGAAGSVRIMWAEDNVAAVGSRHAIRHVLAENSAEVDAKDRAYFDWQSVSLNRMSLWHLVTSVLLGGLSAWSLARRDRQRASNEELQPPDQFGR